MIKKINLSNSIKKKNTEKGNIDSILAKWNEKNGSKRKPLSVGQIVIKYGDQIFMCKMDGFTPVPIEEIPTTLEDFNELIDNEKPNDSLLNRINTRNNILNNSIDKYESLVLVEDLQFILDATKLENSPPKGDKNPSKTYDQIYRNHHLQLIKSFNRFMTGYNINPYNYDEIRIEVLENYKELKEFVKEFKLKKKSMI
ncbi:hypothetical protein ACTFIY_010963 [Dictyostelium cf. discoideum]